MAVKNNIRLIGNIGNNAEVITFENGRSVVTTTLATNKYLGKDDSGEHKTRPQWHTLKFFRKNEGAANKTADKLKKGTQIALQGELDYDSWTDENDKGRVSAFIEVESWEKL